MDKEKLEFGRQQTVVWTKKNSSLDKGKLKFGQRKTEANSRVILSVAKNLVKSLAESLREILRFTQDDRDIRKNQAKRINKQ